MLTEIERIKKQGAIDALRQRINNLQWDIAQGVWKGGYMVDSKISGLGKKLAKVKLLVKDMEETIKALNELQPGNT